MSTKGAAEDAADVQLAEAWEATVGSDTPLYREALATAERDAAALQKSMSNILTLARASLKAAEAAAAARRELSEALAVAGGEAFSHPDLQNPAAVPPPGVSESPSDDAPPPLSKKVLLELFSQMELADTMHGRQLQSLIIEPLQAQLDDTHGLASLPKLSSTYGALSHDFYESLAEFLALVRPG